MRNLIYLQAFICIASIAHPSALAAPVASSIAGSGHCIPGKVTNFSARYRSYASGYFPDDSEMEGGFLDRKDQDLRTLQSYLRGEADYVSAAMDHLEKRLPYGTIIRIPALELQFHRCIEFRVVDTGDRFKGRGTRKVDVCHETEEQTEMEIANGWTDVYVVGRAP